MERSGGFNDISKIKLNLFIFGHKKKNLSKTKEITCKGS